MPEYVEIAVNVSHVSGVFHYHLPVDLEGKVKPGHLVEAPFGRQRVQGVVLRPVEIPEVEETKEVLSLVDPHPVVTAVQIELARYLAESTLSPFSACIDLMLPPGLSQHADSLFTLEPSAGDTSDLSSLQQRLLRLIEERGPLRGRQIDQAMPRIDWRPSARKLVQKGLISDQPVLLEPSVRPKRVRTASLSASDADVETWFPNVGKAGSEALARRQAMLRFLQRERGWVDVAWVYAESGGSLADLKKLNELGLVALGEAETWRDPLNGVDYLPTQPPELTADQRGCLEAVQAGLRQATEGQALPPFLLHGVTGSGKTEIYLQAAESAIQAGGQAIILVPEIALTPQTVRRFLSRFPGRVGLVHSKLSAGERYDTWRRARDGTLDLVVGPRSALFTPLPLVKLIVLDECHDSSYYQSEPPFYHTQDAASAYARLSGAVCIFGSATPNITQAYQARQGKWRSLRLPERIMAHHEAVQAQVQKFGLQSHYRKLEGQAEVIDLPPVEVVDMRAELKAGNRSIFSRSLTQAMQQVLDHHQQAILFLNRRGTSTYIFCRDCGYTLKCPQCDLPLTLHTPQGALMCHHCGYRRSMPDKCPECGQTRIRQFGTGTEKVEAEVQALFPGCRTLRWDFETTRKKGAHDEILSKFSARQADILVGTQMLAKGLDLPLVTLVGVVLADVGLSLPDYSASERTFQVLTQVSGRAGRSPLGGRVVLQTFQPEHYVIKAASGHSYEDFYRQELGHRKELGYPPFTRLVRLEYRHLNAEKAETQARKMASQVLTWIREQQRSATEIVGPAPCFFSRVSGYFRWQIVLRGPDPASLFRGRSLGEWRVEVNPPSLL